MTNVLALPKASLLIETRTNEDWVDTLIFLVNSTDPVNGPQLDLSDVKFEMEIRRNAPDHEVILSGSTEDGRLSIGAAPDYGTLIISIPVGEMATRQAGEYVGDIRASDDLNTHVCAEFTMTIVQGITR